MCNSATLSLREKITEIRQTKPKSIDDKILVTPFYAGLPEQITDLIMKAK